MTNLVINDSSRELLVKFDKEQRYTIKFDKENNYTIKFNTNERFLSLGDNVTTMETLMLF